MYLNDDGELDKLFIDQLQTYFNNQQIAYKKYFGYSIGDNPPILSREEKEAPDNRVPAPIAKKLVSTVKGYMGKPGYITYSSSDPEYAQEIKADVLDTNDEELLTADLLNDALSIGWAYELQIVTPELALRLYRIPANQGLMIYDDTLEANKIAFVYLRTRQEITGGLIAEYQVMTIYYANFWVEYERRLNNAVWVETDRQEHIFGDVPATEYRINQNKLPVYHAVIRLMDELDKTLSQNYANEQERFANATLLAATKLNAEIIARLGDVKAFDDINRAGDVPNVNSAFGYLTKPARGSDVAEWADRLERLIYDNAMVPNMSAISDGANQSGEALTNKMWLLEWLASDIQGYFSRGLQDRFVLIGMAWQEIRGVPVQDITISFRRNMPENPLTMAQTAGALIGILSKRTILEKVFPADWVSDVDAELQQLQDTLPGLTDDRAIIS
jgi:SPP1 family phage portal protein